MGLISAMMFDTVFVNECNKISLGTRVLKHILVQFAVLCKAIQEEKARHKTVDHKKPSEIQLYSVPWVPLS